MRPCPPGETSTNPGPILNAGSNFVSYVNCTFGSNTAQRHGGVVFPDNVAAAVLAYNY